MKPWSIQQHIMYETCATWLCCSFQRICATDIIIEVFLWNISQRNKIHLFIIVYWLHNPNSVQKTISRFVLFKESHPQFPKIRIVAFYKQVNPLNIVSLLILKIQGVIITWYFQHAIIFKKHHLSFATQPTIRPLSSQHKKVFISLNISETTADQYWHEK